MPYPTPLVNSSLVDLDEDIELTCTGEIGSTQGPIMEWFRKTENNMNMFVVSYGFKFSHFSKKKKTVFQIFLFLDKMSVTRAGVHTNTCQNSKQGRP